MREGGEGVTRGIDVEAGQRAASTGPTCRRQREGARRAVAFVEAKCPAGDVDPCGSLTGGPVRWVHTEPWFTCLGGVFG